MTQNRVIGRNNNLPWQLPDDLKYFQNITKGHVVIMGRKNFDSLPSKFKPLPNRTNIVLTRKSNFKMDGCLIFKDLKDAIRYAESIKELEVFIMGGGEIYRHSLQLANKIYLTEIHHSLDGDIYFPEIDNNWIELSRIYHTKDSKHKYSFDFVEYENSCLK